MKVQGRLKLVRNTQEFSSKFRKRDCVIEVPDKENKFTQYITIEFLQDKVALLDNWKEGDDVEISINLRGREWEDKKTNTTKYFNSIVGWQIKSAEPVSVEDHLNTGDDMPF
tara:strand:+ start:160 stop:495 length:336 start_codon:yes stop_codon:yes gene_type:complete